MTASRGSRDIRLASPGGPLAAPPILLAVELGFFEDEGINIEYTPGANAGLLILAGEADVGLGGMWRPIMFRHRVGDLRVFAQAIGRCPIELVSRDRDTLDVASLDGSVIVATGASGPTEAFITGIARRHGVAAARPRFLRWAADDAHAMFRGGVGDFLISSYLETEAAVEQGWGKRAQSLAELGGPVPWGVLYAARNYLDENLELVGRFCRAVLRGLTVLTAPLSTEHEQAIDRMLLSHYEGEQLRSAHRVFRDELARKVWIADPRLPRGPALSWQKGLLDLGYISDLEPFEEFCDERPASWAIELSG